MAGNQLPYPRNASGGGGGSGTVTSVSVTTANGVSGSVATATTTPAISLTLGAITPSTVNALTLASQTTGFTIAGGTTSKTLTVPLDASVSGTNTGDQTITLTGDVTGSGTGSFATTLTNSAVIGKVLTGYTSGAGTVAATDTILQAIQKLNGNVGALVTGVSSVAGRTGAVTLAQADISGLTTASSPSFTTGTFTGASSLTLGTASSLAGGIIFKNGTNANTLTIQSGVTGATIAYILPITAPTDGQVLSSLATGVMSWATASGLSWASSITGTSGTGLTLTVGNSASASTVGQSIVIGNTQTNAVTGLSIDAGIDAGQPSRSNKNISLVNKATDGTGIEINVYGSATQILGSAGTRSYGINSGTNFNTNSLYDHRLINLQVEANTSSGSNVGLRVHNNATTFTVSNANMKGTGVGIYQNGTGGTALAILATSNVNSSTNGIVNYTLDNTQSAGTVMQKIDLGTSAQGHTGLLINAFNASTSIAGIKIDMSTTGTGRGLSIASTTTAPIHINLDNSSSGALSANSTAGVLRVFGANGFNYGTNTSNRGVQALFGLQNSTNNTFMNVEMTGARGSANNPYADNTIFSYGIGLFGDIRGTASDTALIWMTNQSTSTTSSNRPSYYIFANDVVNANLSTTTARTVDMNFFGISRTNTATTGTVADSFNNMYIKDTAIQNGAGGTLTSAGSVLKLETVATQTAGTLTHTKDVLNLTQSATVTTGKLLTGVVGSTERFKVHPMVANSGTNNAYLFDTTTSLSGTTTLGIFANAGTAKWTLDNAGNETITGAITTGAPSGGTAGAWKTGILVTATVAADTTRYIQLDVGGTLYKVIISSI